MKSLLLTLLVCCKLLSYGQSPVGKGILVNPVTIDFRLNSGQTSTGKVLITNRLPKKKQFTIYLSDWDRDTLGAHIYTAPGSSRHSCSKWIKLEKTFVEIDSLQTAEINFKIQVPDSVDATSEMKWAMLFLETTEEQIVENPDGVRTKVNNRMRVGVHIYQTPPLLLNKDVRILAFEQLKDSTRKCHILCQNTGSVQIECNSYIELSNVSTGQKTKVEVPLFPMFPGQKRVVEFEIPNDIPKGKYSLIGVIDAGTDVPMEAAQKMIDI
ncbi:hypothetical protein ACDQ55_17465 [Chitinophaga sp. 30R24]|uniref:hypothetical protein n=1 Tax=Chitinophaga sp. 30R24 TaxID=3248838 RepID=UPI003B91FB99